MASTTQLSSGKWRVQIRRKGVGYKEGYFDSREEADAWAEKTEADLLKRHHEVAPKVQEKTLTFSEVVRRYFDAPVFSNKAPSTQDRERDASQRVLDYFGRTAIGVMDSLMVQDYLDLRSREKKRLKSGKLSDTVLSGNTVRLEKAFLTQIFKFAKARKIVPMDIMRDDFDLPTCVSREGRISVKQQYALYKAAEEMAEHPRTNKSFLPWLWFVFETGTRPGEAAKIELSWLDLDKKRVLIPRRGSKKRNPRVILLRDELAEEVRKQQAFAIEAGSPYLFWSRENEPRVKEGSAPKRRRRTKEETASRKIVPFAYYHAWRRLCDKAGVPRDINPHIVRHEFISRLFEETDFNDSQIAALVGDVNVLSLEPYKHLRVEKLRDKSEAHLVGVRDALNQLHEQEARTHAENMEKLHQHISRVLREAREEREAAGEFTTPMERLHAGMLEAGVLKKKVADGPEDK